MIVQLSRSLSRAAPVVHRSIHSGTRPASTAASKLHADRPLTSEEIYAREDKYGAHNYHPLPVALERGKGELIFHEMGQITQKSLADTFQELFPPFLLRHLCVGCGRQPVLWLPKCLQCSKPGPLSPKDHRRAQRPGLQTRPDFQSILQRCAGNLWGIHHQHVWLWQSLTHEYRYCRDCIKHL